MLNPFVFSGKGCTLSAVDPLSLCGYFSIILVFFFFENIVVYAGLYTPSYYVCEISRLYCAKYEKRLKSMFSHGGGDAPTFLQTAINYLCPTIRRSEESLIRKLRLRPTPL
jgi:hypothetical protein